jgi:hypothetical protein
MARRKLIHPWSQSSVDNGPGRFRTLPDNEPRSLPGLYGILNLENNKWYIGESYNLRIRRKDYEHLKKFRSRFLKALNEYKLENFLFVPLCYLFDSNQESRRVLEVELIKSFDSVRYGYNSVLKLFGQFKHSYGPTFAAAVKAARSLPASRAKTRAASKKQMANPLQRAAATAVLARGCKQAGKKGVAKLKELWADPIWAEQQRKNRREKAASPETRQRIVAANRRNNSNPATRLKLSNSGLIAQNRPEVKANNSAQVTRSWQKPERRLAQSKSSSRVEVWGNMQKGITPEVIERRNESIRAAFARKRLQAQKPLS